MNTRAKCICVASAILVVWFNTSWVYWLACSGFAMWESSYGELFNKLSSILATEFRSLLTTLAHLPIQNSAHGLTQSQLNSTELALQIDQWNSESLSRAEDGRKFIAQTTSTLLTFQVLSIWLGQRLMFDIIPWGVVVGIGIELVMNSKKAALAFTSFHVYYPAWEDRIQKIRAMKADVQNFMEIINE